MLGLGGSVSTPKSGITADVLVVNNYDDLESKSDKVKGKIVLYNVPFTNYSETVQYRYSGASRAAKYGAVASLVRSIGDWSMDTPHTGVMGYDENYDKIPTAALTMEDAMMLGRIHERKQKITLKLHMEAKTVGDRWSRNIISEIKGHEHPDELVVVGAHIDSWDVGQGAHDDGGGCIASWEVLRLIKTLGLKPKRTIRCVLWTNEENGLRGANAYRNKYLDKLKDHILAIESDAGVFKPSGFGFTGPDESLYILQDIGTLLKPIQSGVITKGGGGADIGPIMAEGVPGMGLTVESKKYFWYHHTAADTWDKLNIQEFNQCVATMAVMSFVVADMDIRLPK